jgi:hypothetical protein
MSFDLVSDVFDPVFQRLVSKREFLTGYNPQHHPTARGLENNYLHPETVFALRDQGYPVIEQTRQGVDLIVRTLNPDREFELELKAGNDLRVYYIRGIERDGWLTKYVEREQHALFAGCLFLGCDSAKWEFKINAGGSLKL